jgi:hypothetical protein
LRHHFYLAWDRFAEEAMEGMEDLEDGDTIEIEVPDTYVLFDHAKRAWDRHYPNREEDPPHFGFLITEVEQWYGHHRLYAACYVPEALPIFEDVIAGLKSDLMPARKQANTRRGPPPQVTAKQAVELQHEYENLGGKEYCSFEQFLARKGVPRKSYYAALQRLREGEKAA